MCLQTSSMALPLVAKDRRICFSSSSAIQAPIVFDSTSTDSA